ncbi:MAG: tetratricopeptide repeat protein [Flavobacteriia bacterium]|nr:tetratricopeptide repeat protein [Flavobacteriia bacterium]
MKSFIVLCLLAFSISPAFGQESTDQQLANLYYNNGEYAKALEYFEKLVNKQSTKFDLLRYAECLEKTENLKEAEKVFKRARTQFPTDIEMPILLGEFYERTNRVDQADKLYNELIKNASISGYQVVELYDVFRKKGKTETALKTLETGRKELKKSYPLQLQFAEVYGLLGRTDDMVDEYFAMLDEFPNYRSGIEASLSKQIDFVNDESGIYGKLKDKLLQRIQKKPGETIYAEMLIWLFVQKKEFKSALVQAQALDKREKGQGNRVMELGETCLQNSDYATARNAYKYVIELGDAEPNFYRAYSSLLNVRFREITYEKRFSETDITAAVSEYRSALKIIGWNRNAIRVARELAIIQAYYGNDATSAAQLLDSCLAMPGLTDMQKAEIKMSLADVLVLQDDIWQASLYYMQIDKEFKYETIGHEAKFKNARIFYYDGDFLFAQSQLDVLKQSTSKLIANDAMKLSILITDNLGLDSNYTAMNLFAKADLLLEQHQFASAFKLYDTINQAFPYHGLADEIYLRKAQAMQQQGKWEEAVGYLEKIVSEHGDDILADDAVFQMGEIYEKHLNNPEKAAEYYKKILFEFKGSLLTVEARKRFRTLRGDAAVEDDI